MDDSGVVRAWLGRMLFLGLLGAIMYILRLSGVITGL